MATAEEVRALLQEHLVGELEDTAGTLRVNTLDVARHAEGFTVEADVTAADGRWRVGLDYGGPHTRVFEGRPSPETVRSLVVVIATQLFEWWHTKDTERASARPAVRLP
jgi:hypothetical protein